MKRKTRKNSKPFKNTAKNSTTDFLKILAVIIDHPGNRSFQVWNNQDTFQSYRYIQFKVVMLIRLKLFLTLIL